jgi:O-methyltransferase
MPTPPNPTASDIVAPPSSPAQDLWIGLQTRAFGPAYKTALREALPDIAARAAFVNSVVAEVLGADHGRIFWGDRMLTIDKSASFLDDPGFRAAFDAVWSDYPYDQYGGRDTISWRLHTLVWAARQAHALPAGDFVECGVFRGDMAWVVATVTGFDKTSRKFVLFDSFEGLDPAQAKDGDYPDNPGYLEFANKYYSENGLFEGVVRRFASFQNVSVVRGYLPGTLCAPHVPDEIAFLHIDLNSPAVELACLRSLFGRVVQGGMIIFDDYGWRSFRQQKQVADQFFAEHGLSVLELPTGQGLVVKI